VLTSPPGPDGAVNPLVLAAADLIGAEEVFAIGGAHAIAALALGTESIPKVDAVVGPGNRYVQEAKRQLAGRVRIDGIAGPSELMVIADDTVDGRLLALDLCAQAEHGDDGLLVACATEESVLGELERIVTELAAERPTVGDPPLALVMTPTTGAAMELANALAPEHLELACADAEDLAAAARFAGCVFVGREGATAFGDYAAGSNHVLPTGGAGRFQGPLSPSTFRRRLTTVRLTERGVDELAPVVATLAEAEGFPVHGESVTARARKPEE
jgi:histidinol dehydrogenase